MYKKGGCLGQRVRRGSQPRPTSRLPPGTSLQGALGQRGTARTPGWNRVLALAPRVRDPAFGDSTRGRLYRRRVAQRFQIAIDCLYPDRLAAFWSRVLGYEVANPPAGYDSWAEHAREQAEEPGEAWIKIVDPGGTGPTVLFHRVAEPKTSRTASTLMSGLRTTDRAAGNSRSRSSSKTSSPGAVRRSATLSTTPDTSQ